MGGHNGERSGERERVDGRKENLAGESSGVRGREGGRKASRVAENPRSDRQGVGGGVELPRGINTPGVEELPKGGRNLPSESQGRRSAGRRWKGAGRERRTTTRETKAHRDSDGDEEMTSGPGPAPLLSPQWSTAANRGSAVTPHRHPDGADGARPKRTSARASTAYWRRQSQRAIKLPRRSRYAGTATTPPWGRGTRARGR